MNANELHKATVMTIAIVVERLYTAISTSADPMAAIEQLVLLERGVNLLMESICNERDITTEQIDELRRDLQIALQDDSLDKLAPDVLHIDLPKPPDDPTLN